MDYLTRGIGGVLDTFLRLIFLSVLLFPFSASADIVQTPAEALALCQSRVALVTSRTTPGPTGFEYQAKCVSRTLEPSNGRFGAIFCLQHAVRRDLDPSTSGTFGYCLATGQSSNLGTGATALSRYTSETFSPPALNTVSYNSWGLFAWTVDQPPPELDCDKRKKFDSSTMRGSGPGGLGPVCHDGCAYDVFGAFYRGTFPAGHPFWEFRPSGAKCKPGEDTEPLPDDSPIGDDPLDIPDYAEPGPDPGDGNTDSASGGATCATPPQCKGNSVQCAILYQTWATRCSNTAGDPGGDGSWQGSPGGPGGPGGDGSDVDLTPLTDRWDNTFGNGSDLGEPLDGLPMRSLTLDSSLLNDGGLGLGRSCPQILLQPISVGFFGSTSAIDFSMFCSMLDLVGQILILLAAFFSVRILLADRK